MAKKLVTQNSSIEDSAPSRRSFLKQASGLLGAAAVAAPTVVSSEAFAAGYDYRALANRATEAYKVRVNAATIQFLRAAALPQQQLNDDEARYRYHNYYASFTKTLPHNNFGEVDPNAFRALVKAMETKQRRDFDAIPLATGATMKLANPQGALRVALAGADSFATRISAPPTLRSAEMAAEMAEVYWLALTRDVPFSLYDASSMVSEAITDLNRFSFRVGPTENRKISINTLFRGLTKGDLTGPYVSQFLWLPFKFGPASNVQRYSEPVLGRNFMTSTANWLNVQNGRTPAETLSFTGQAKYIYNNRMLGEYLRSDVSFQAYLNAALIMLSYGGAALSPTNPYRSAIKNQGAFTSFGAPFILDLLTQAANLSLSGAWFQKWSVHRKLRPEAMAGRVNFHVKRQRNYEIHRDLLNSSALTKLYSQYGTYHLPMGFTEGSPTHPSYPAGHGTISGACATILKAMFDENFAVPNPVVANEDGTELLTYSGDTLRLGGEINKLASNISLGRNAPGVHYRSDGYEGMLAGEQQAIGLLQDITLTLNEPNDGFVLTKFDGTRIRIANGKVVRI